MASAIDDADDGPLIYGGNEATRAVDPSQPGLSHRSHRDLFVAGYKQLRKECDRAPVAGMVVMAVHDVSLRVYTCGLPAVAGTPTTLVIGRHTQTDLTLQDDPGISLRHLLLVARRPAEGRVALRVFDLRTPTAFYDEDGQRLASIVAVGTVVLTVGSYALFCVDVQQARTWPSKAARAWDALPKRVYIDAEPAPPPEVSCDSLNPEASEGDTLVRRLRPVVPVSARLAAPGGYEAGHLAMSLDDMTLQGPVDVDTLRSGVLFGRYDRCDTPINGRYSEDAGRISRVHLLLVADGNDVLAIDTASSNGTYGVDGNWLRCAVLGPEATLSLASGVAFVRWKRRSQSMTD